jgi:molybdopterin molybdotransferase
MTFSEARACVVREVRAGRRLPPVECVALADAAGRVLAEDVAADRDTPETARAMRDGYAVRAADLPGALDVIGEVRAGEVFTGSVGPGQAVEIMTGAPVPDGADAIVMVEHTVRDGNRMRADTPTAPFQHINQRGCEAAAGQIVLHAGTRLDYTGVALLAAFGHRQARVYRKPRVAILPTGDEVVEVEEQPKPHQVRNSNAWSLATQAARAGAKPVILPIARDTVEHTHEMVKRGLACDLLLLSGGVSAGKYDVVEVVLAQFGARFFFDRVLIQPGQPLVFGMASGRWIFGLPGNPASTIVTFEVFARAAIDLASGCEESVLPFSWARLTADFRCKPGLTRFLPARRNEGGEVTPTGWRGSSDLPSLARANCYLVTDPDRGQYARGDFIQVLAK